MIGAKLFYQITMNETNWMMSAEEYEEFRAEALNLPIYFKSPAMGVYIPGVNSDPPFTYLESDDTEKDKEIRRLKDSLETSNEVTAEHYKSTAEQNHLIEKLYAEIEILKNNKAMSEVQEATRMDEDALLSLQAKAERIAEELEAACPDFIEPPEEDEELEEELEVELDEIEDLNEFRDDFTPAINYLAPGEDEGDELVPELLFAKKKETKKPRPFEKADYSKYIKMLEEGQTSKDVRAAMSKDLGIVQGTASLYFYKFVKNNAKKVTIIPPFEGEKPQPGKLFSEGFKSKIRKETGLDREEGKKAWK